MKKLAVISALLCGFLSTTQAKATIGIDSMMKFAENGQTSFLITNSADYRQFMQIAISSLSVVNGELVKTPYTKNNISDWRLSAKPSRSMINPRMQKEFAVQFKPKNDAENDIDQAFQLTIVPTPYFSGDEKPQHAMQIAVGFAPYVVVPAKKDQPLTYEITRQSNKLVLTNKGKTYIRAMINACPVNTKKEDLTKCMKTVHALSGRHLNIELNDEFQKAKDIKIQLSTHNAQFKESFNLSNGQKRRV